MYLTLTINKHICRPLYILLSIVLAITMLIFDNLRIQQSLLQNHSDSRNLWKVKPCSLNRPSEGLHTPISVNGENSIKQMLFILNKYVSTGSVIKKILVYKKFLLFKKTNISFVKITVRLLKIISC